MQLIESNPALAAMLPATHYFEVDSQVAGARYAIWITLPPRYDQEAQARYPVIYLSDGNLTAPMLAPAMPLLRDDPINPIVPFIQVCVGYAGEEAARQLAVRARDLLPPGEPLPPGFDEPAMDWLVQLGMLDAEGARLYLRHLRNPAGHRFLQFLSDELHPLIALRHRIDPDATGLYGYSYGGLFASYAAVCRSIFRRVGAGSLGIIPKVSKVLGKYREQQAAGTDFSGRMLHMTVCEAELTAPSYYQPLVGAGTMDFLALARQMPLPGLQFSAHIQAHESHATGLASSWFSFLRACYAAPTSWGKESK